MQSRRKPFLRKTLKSRLRSARWRRRSARGRRRAAAQESRLLPRVARIRRRCGQPFGTASGPHGDRGVTPIAARARAPSNRRACIGVRAVGRRPALLTIIAVHSPPRRYRAAKNLAAVRAGLHRVRRGAVRRRDAAARPPAARRRRKAVRRSCCSRSPGRRRRRRRRRSPTPRSGRCPRWSRSTPARRCGSAIRWSTTTRCAGTSPTSPSGCRGSGRRASARA